MVVIKPIKVVTKPIKVVIVFKPIKVVIDLPRKNGILKKNVFGPAREPRKPRPLRTVPPRVLNRVCVLNGAATISHRAG